MSGKDWLLFLSYQLKMFYFPSPLPPTFKFEKNKGQRSSGQKQHFFLCHHHSERLSGIRWQRTPSPGLTVKGEAKAFETLSCRGSLCLRGEGSKWAPLRRKAAAIYWPRTKIFPQTRSSKPAAARKSIDICSRANNCFGFSISQALKTNLLNSSLVASLLPR